MSSLPINRSSAYIYHKYSIYSSKQRQFNPRKLNLCISPNQGKCLDVADEFTKPKSGQVIATFDKLGPDFSVTFDLKINSAQSDYSNILFATSASADKLAKADFDDLLQLHGNINHDAAYPEINRHPGIWVMPGQASDTTAGLMICAEYVKWENSSGRPLERCFSHKNVDFWKKLTIGEW